MGGNRKKTVAHDHRKTLRGEKVQSIIQIPPVLPLQQGGKKQFPLWKRGMKGDLT
jgi:hypothetical protein